MDKYEGIHQTDSIGIKLLGTLMFAKGCRPLVYINVSCDLWLSDPRHKLQLVDNLFSSLLFIR